MLLRFHEHFQVQLSGDLLKVKDEQAFEHDHGRGPEREQLGHTVGVVEGVFEALHGLAAVQGAHVGGKLGVVDAIRDVEVDHAVRVGPLLGERPVVVVLRDEAQLLGRESAHELPQQGGFAGRRAARDAD